MLNTTLRDDKGNVLGTNREMLTRRNPNDERLHDPVLNGFELYWMWVFSQLNRNRNYDQGCPFPISLRTFKDYQELFNDHLDEDEVLLLQAMDDAFIEALNKGKA